MLADEVDYVIGVDTHRDQHTLAVVVSPTGAVVAQSSIRTDRHGYEAALEVAGRHTVGARLWAIEGCGQACGCQNSVLPANRRFLGARTESCRVARADAGKMVIPSGSA